MKPRSLLGLAALAQAGGDYPAAAEFIEQAQVIANATKMLPIQPLVALASGRLAAAQGNHALALEFLTDAEAQADTLNLRPTVLQARLAAAESLDALGERSRADEKRQLADEKRREIANLISDVELRNDYLAKESATIALHPEKQIA
jgi:hypothetical protein